MINRIHMMDLVLTQAYVNYEISLQRIFFHDVEKLW